MAKESMPFELKRPNAGTPVTNTSEIDHGTGASKKPLDILLGRMPDTDDEADSDLDIVDGQGYVLVRFKDGHIQVKNFNSVDILDSVQAILSNIGFDKVPEFDEDENYSVGDVVRHGKYVYVFTASHTAGEWDDADVERTAITPDVPIDLENASLNTDLDVSDEQGNVLARFSEGHFKTKKFDSQKTPTINNEALGDLEIADENGNVLVRFKDGHIRTKEFNSANITPTPTNDHVLKGKRVAFIGDSITQGSNASPQADNRYTTVFQQITGSIVTNLGISGTCLANNTLNSLSSQRFVTRATATNLADKDCIFVFGGTNDFSYDSKAIGNHFSEEPITGGTYIGTKKKVAISDTDTFAGALHELILQIRSVAPNARLIFITPLSRGRYATGRPTCAECNQWGDYMQDFIDTIKDICYFYAIPVIDLYTLFNQDWRNDISGSMSSMDSDGIHPNNAGHQRIAKILAKWCESNLIV